MNMILCGYKASGKTTLARAYSHLYQCAYIDTDDLIVDFFESISEVRTSIQDIYSMLGEQLFRIMEYEVLQTIEKVDDAIIALGAVIRGGTPHFEYVAGECVKGMAQVTLSHGVPIAFGVLTVDTIEQAIERSGTKAGNKGAEAAASTIEMVNLLSSLD